MAALASLRGFNKYVLIVLIALLVSTLPQTAQAAVTLYPSVDGFILSSVSPRFPLIYGESGDQAAGHKADDEVMSLASDLMRSQPAPMTAFQVYPLEMMPAHVLLRNYAATVLPETGMMEMEEEVAQLHPQAIADSIFKMLMPVSNAYISSKFGWRRGRPHQGTDFAAPTGTAITAVENGKVIYAGWMNGYGKLIAVDHGNGLVTRYAHCSGIGVKTGQHVNKGSLIGRVGNTGRSTGPHLHFEVLAHGVHKNPEQYLNQAKTIVHAN